MICKLIETLTLSLNKLKGTCREMKSGDLCERDNARGLIFDDWDGREYNFETNQRHKKKFDDGKRNCENIEGKKTAKQSFAIKTD